MQVTRRGFMRILGAAAAVTATGTGRILLADTEVPDKLHRWVRDEGDFYRVRVPAGLSMKNESFDKPVLLILERRAQFLSCSVDGFVNAYMEGEGLVRDCSFDTRNYRHTDARAPMAFLSPGDGNILTGCIFLGTFKSS